MRCPSRAPPSQGAWWTLALHGRPACQRSFIDWVGPRHLSAAVLAAQFMGSAGQRRRRHSDRSAVL